MIRSLKLLRRTKTSNQEGKKASIKTKFLYSILSDTAPEVQKKTTRTENVSSKYNIWYTFKATCKPATKPEYLIF